MTTSTAHRVLFRYLESAHLVNAAGFTKYHPIAKVVEKQLKTIVKAEAAALRFGKIIENAFRYHGDETKAKPNAEKMLQAVEILVSNAKAMVQAAEKYGDEIVNAANDARSMSVGAELFRWINNLNDRLESGELARRMQDLREASGFDLKITAWGIRSDIEKISQAAKNVDSEISNLAKVSIGSPTSVDPNASPEDRFRAFMTPEILSIAKTCAKKLGGNKAACAVLGGDVMEDVNAHSELRTIMPMLQPYYGDIRSDEEAGKAIGSLTGKVSSAIDWGVIQAGAFCATILKVVGAPEAERVIDTLAKAFAPLTKD